MEQPINKYLANDYRVVIGTDDAPATIDPKNAIIPVVDIQKGFPKPNSKQTYKTKAFNNNGVGYNTISSVDSNKDVYLVAIAVSGVNGGYINVGDGTDSAVDSTNGSTTHFIQIASAGLYDFPLPIKCNVALGIYGSVINQGFVVHYIEEIKK